MSLAEIAANQERKRSVGGTEIPPETSTTEKV